jgi:hypothetical protein
MATPATHGSPTHPTLQLPFNRMEREGSNERDVPTRVPRILCNENEGRNAVELQSMDVEMAASEGLSPFYRDSTAAAAAVLDAEVVEERDLQQEVQERIANMTIDAVLVVNMSTNEDESTKAQSDLQRKSAAILRKVAALLVVLMILSGIVIGTKTLRPKPNATFVAASHSTSISVLEFARNLLTPLSGEIVFMDDSSSQYKALWWIVHEDPANMMMRLMVGNETQSSSSLLMMMMIMERYIMALLYFSTDGPNWILPYDFLGNESVCDWGELIECSEEEAVVRIRMGE